MTAEPSLADQKMIETTASEESLITKIDTKQIDAKREQADQNLVTAASNPIIENDVKPANIAARAQELPIALLPNFTSAPKDRKPAQIQPDENNGDAS